MFEKYNAKCCRCGWSEVNQYTGNIPLEIEHIDGNYLNNNEENLILLCPNCHSLTSTYKGANKGHGRKDRGKYSLYNQERKQQNLCTDCHSPISKGAIRCKKCQSKHQITLPPIKREELKAKIRTESFVKIGKEFKVSDNAIRKWCQKFKLPSTKRDINSYSDEEWELL